MLNYEELSDELAAQIQSDRERNALLNVAFDETNVIRRDNELELSEYHPCPLDGFDEFDHQIEACYLDKQKVRKLIPTTLEGCVMRISDIIAYLGKDRQDAEKADILQTGAYEDCAIGTYNAEIINNLIVNIVENSYGKPYIQLDATHFEALKKAKADNYDLIYKNDTVRAEVQSTVRPMMRELYKKLLSDLQKENKSSPIFTHHIDYVNKEHYKREMPYEQTEPNQIVVDYLASMTDDYFVDLYAYLFPESKLKITYRGYFDGCFTFPNLATALHGSAPNCYGYRNISPN